MTNEEVERRILRSALIPAISYLVGIPLLFLLSEGSFSWLGYIMGAVGFLSVGYTAYSRNIEAHYKLAKYLPEEYSARLRQALESKSVGGLTVSNWFIKLEEELRHKFKR